MHVPFLIFLCIGPLSKKIRIGGRLNDPFRNEFVFYGEGYNTPTLLGLFERTGPLSEVSSFYYIQQNILLYGLCCSFNNVL
jgi:hypothetical protein